MNRAKVIVSLLVLLAAGATGISKPAVAATSGDAAWFQRETQTLLDSIAAGNKAPWEAILASRCIITTEDGDVLDRTAFLKSLQPLPPGFSGTIKARHLTVRQLGDAAVVHYWLDEHEDVFGQHLHTMYVETDTYRRDGIAWHMIAAQTTVVPRDLEAIRVNTRNWPALTGVYAYNATSGPRYHVYLRNGALFGGSNEKTATLLIPLSPLVFHQKGSIHIMVFVRNAAGAVDEIRELHKYNEVIMRRIPSK